MGQLIPVMCDEVVPGDVFEIGNEAVVRFQPLVAPILHESIFMFIIFCTLSSLVGFLGEFYYRRY